MADLQGKPEGSAVRAPTALIECPKCGRSNSVGTRYCIICGERLPAMAQGKPVATGSAEKGGFLSKVFGRKKKS